MVLNEVMITEDVYLICLSHSLSTENEEVMGLLLGDIEEHPNGQLALIQAVSVLARSDKRKDRVEISPEQLAGASAQAEKISEQLGKRIRVIGWYHSHPHITVNPSHVDIQTQAMYQQLDSGFVGLIFSCFNKNPSDTSGRVQVTAFQSIRINEPVKTSADKKKTVDIIDLDSPTHNDSNPPIVHHERLERIEIPIKIVPNMTQGPNSLEVLCDLQKILFFEEQQTYKSSISKSRAGEAHPLLRIYSDAIYQKSLVRLLELQTLPTLSMLQNLQHQNELRIRELNAQKAHLEKKLKHKKVKNEL